MRGAASDRDGADDIHFASRASPSCRPGVVLAAIEYIVLMVAVWGDRLFSGGGQWYAAAAWARSFRPWRLPAWSERERGDRRWWRWLGVAATAAALVRFDDRHLARGGRS